MAEETPLVGIVMGSQSDWPVMRHVAATLDSLGIAQEARIISAHRTPKRAEAYASGARERGLKVIIAGAGGAAHLAGVFAGTTAASRPGHRAPRAPGDGRTPCDGLWRTKRSRSWLKLHESIGNNIDDTGITHGAVRTRFVVGMDVAVEHQPRLDLLDQSVKSGEAAMGCVRLVTAIERRRVGDDSVDR